MKLKILLFILVAAFAKTMHAQDTGENSGNSIARMEGSSVTPGAILIDDATKSAKGQVYADSVSISGNLILIGANDTAATRSYVNLAREVEYKFEAINPTSSIPLPFQVDPNRPFTVRYFRLVYDVDRQGAPGDDWFVLQGTTLYITPSLLAGESITLKYTLQQ